MKNKLYNKKIIFFTNDLVLGGAERQSLILAKHLRTTYQADVEFWGFLSTKPELINLLKDNNIKWQIFKDPLRYSSFKKIYLYLILILQIRKQKPDVILSWVYNAKINAGLVWRLTGAKLHIWNQRVEPAYSQQNNGIGELWGNRLEKWAIQLTTVFASNADHSGALLCKYFSIPKDKMHIIPNAIQVRPDLSKQEMRKKFNIPENTFVVGMIANYTRFKDHHTLVQAWKIFIEQFANQKENFLLICAGSPRDIYPGSPGNTYDQTRAYLFDNGISNSSVWTLNYTKDVYELINTFDVGLLASHSEGCPNGLLECMACGVAVTGSDIPGIRFAVGKNNYPYLFNPHDAQDLANKLIQFYTNSELRKQLGEANKNRILTVFNNEVICDQYSHLIESHL